MDYTDLQNITNNFRESCSELSKHLRKESDCYLAWKRKEKEVMIKEWTNLQMEIITTSKYNEIIKFETMQEKIDYEASKLERKICEKRSDSLKEALYSYKKTMNII